MPMLTRRLLTRLLLPHLMLIGVIAATLPGLARAEDPNEAAAVFVRRAGLELASTIGGAKSPEDKKVRLSAYLARVVDEDGIARFCLGRYWQVATPEQQAQYAQLFRRMLLLGIVERMGDLQSGQVSVVVNPVVTRPDGLYVPTVVERSGNKPVKITWLVTQDTGAMRISDVVAEGMSLRQTQRSDIASFLSRNGGDVGALITAMKGRVGE